MPDRDVDPIDPGVDIGHVHLRVADVDRALDFYCGVLGFELQQRYPSRRALADALRRLGEAGISLGGASDHGVSEALYLADPDGNGIELYWDRPRERWPQPQPGQRVEMYVRPLDVADLLAELGAEPTDP